jgi:nucleotide-binding universal stress UspA family protein
VKAYKHILVPTDGTTLSLKAARRAAILAKDLGAEITAVNVMPCWTPLAYVGGAGVPAEVFDERAFEKSTETTAHAALDKVKAAANAARVKFQGFALRDEQPWRAILKTAKAQRCDLIVMASHGRSGVEAILLGSETRKVLAHARQPVLVCR